MKFWNALCLLFWLSSLFAWSQTPQETANFALRPIDHTQNLLSGLAESPAGILVCDREAGNILLLAENHPPQIFLANLTTPIDLAFFQGEYYILEEEPGSLFAIDPTSQQRREIVDGLFRPSAFTFDPQGNAYITLWATGELLKWDRETRQTQLLPMVFDRPADVMFQAPNSLWVADQVGQDGKDGNVYCLDLQGRQQEAHTNLVDPTGLAKDRSGKVFSTVFRTSPSPKAQGGVVELHDKKPPKSVIENLLGPTSLCIDSSGRFVVLEEPTDSVYRYASNGNRTPLVQGFGPIVDAALLPNQEWAVLESGLVDRLRFLSFSQEIQTIYSAKTGKWLFPQLESDGAGNLYLFTAYNSKITVLDRSGTVQTTINNQQPLLIIGKPQGGIYAISKKGQNFTLQSFPFGKGNQSIKLSLPAQPVTGIAHLNSGLLLALKNGSIISLSSAGGIVEEILPPTSYSIQSLAFPTMHTLYFLDADSQSVYRLSRATNTIEKAVEHCIGGQIFAAPEEGVFYINGAGKRFQITPITNPIPDWLLY
ncbi:hypothetical protein GF373_11875 [bacterium]|nr:hypothetical protein [bacterium]